MVRGVEDPVLMESRPAAPSAQPSFVPGRAPASAHAAAHPGYSEFPPIKLGDPEPPRPSSGNVLDDDAKMSRNLPKHDFSKDKSGPNPPPPESIRRYNETYVDKPKGPDNNNFIPGPHLPKPPQLKCSDTPGDPRANVPCPPAHEPTLGESVKHGVGKTWSLIQHFFGGEDHDVEPGTQGAGPRM